jgi:predicted enzyme related to lactoylglutathione lyase
MESDTKDTKYTKDTKNGEATRKIDPVIYPVEDLAASRALFTALLGTEPYIDKAYYVGFRMGDQELGLNPQGHGQGMTGPVGYISVDDIKESLQSLLELGAQVQQDVKDVGGGKLTAVVTDANGNPIGLIEGH